MERRQEGARSRLCQGFFFCYCFVRSVLCLYVSIVGLFFIFVILVVCLDVSTHDMLAGYLTVVIYCSRSSS